MAIANLFWDSCVFIAHLNNESEAYDVKSIAQFLDDARDPEAVKIFTSSIAFAEITPGRLKSGEYGTFEEFLADFRAQVVVVDASPLICARAGELKDLKYCKNGSTGRVLTTGDAIMFATALELEETYGVQISEFHTFDNGAGPRGPEGKALPLLTYHEWCEVLRMSRSQSESLRRKGVNRSIGNRECSDE